MTKPHHASRAELAALREYLLRAATPLARSRQDAEDLVQSAFARLWRIPGPLPSEHALKPMLRTIVKRLAIDRARRAQRWQWSPLPDELPAIPPRTKRERWHAVTPVQLEAALARCKAPDRHAFELHYLQGLSYREIAARLDIALGTVATRLHRTRARLRVELDAMLEGGDETPAD